MTPVLFWALKLALLLLAVAMLCALSRLLIGPTAQDRVMATVNRMMPALMKCGPNPKVQAAFDKLSVFREHGKK